MTNDMRKAPPDYDCQRHGDPPSGFVCPKCGSTMDESPREAAAAQERAGDDMRKALERIAAIENQESGSDWAEIEEAREIANAALQATQSRPVTAEAWDAGEHEGCGADSSRAFAHWKAGEPVAWVVFAENGNVRLWGKDRAGPQAFADEKGLKCEPVYLAAPPAAAAPEQDRLRLALNDALNRGDWGATERAMQAIRLAADDYPKRREGWVR